MRSSTNLVLRLVLTFIACLAGMTIYEIAKQLIWPSIGIWQSHLITIFVSGALSTICAYFIFRRSDWMQQKLTEELAERQRAELNLRKNEEDLRITLNSIGDAVIATDAEGRIIRMNPVAERLTGWPLEDARAKLLTEVFKIRSEATGQLVENPVEKVLREGVVVGLANHTELIPRSGKLVPITDSGAPIRDAAGRIVGVVLVFRDQSTERAAEDELRRSAGLMTALISNLPFELWAKGIDGKYILQNPASQKAWGNQIGKDDSEQPGINDEIRTQWQAVNQRALTGETVHNEWTRQGPKNDVHVIQEVVGPIYDGDKVRGVLGVNIDITEQRNAERSQLRASEALRQSEERFQLVVRGANDGIWDRNLATNQIFFSDRYLELIGYSRTEFSSAFSEFESHLHPDDHGRVIEEIDAHLKNRTRYDVEFRFRTKLNGYRWFRSRGQAIWNADGVPLRMAGSISDITDQRLMDEALRESEDRFRRLADAPFEGICISDEGQIVDLNNQFARLLGYATAKELVGKGVADVVAPQSRETVFKNIRERSEQPYENWLLRRDGTIFQVESRGRYLPYRGRMVRVTVFRDITEQKQTEQKLIAYQQQLQSLSSRLLIIEERERRNFSQLLHDHIGQSLTYAKLRLGVLRSQLTDRDVLEPLQEVLDLIEDMSHETRSLTYELSPPLLYEIGLDAALEWLCEHFEARYNLDCIFEGTDEPERLEIDARIVLFQATRELLFNVVKHAKATNAKVSTLRGNGSVRLSVKDDGIGMKSTKPVTPESASFGLFSIRERMQHIGGAIHIESEQTGGTCVTLVLPINPALPQS